MSRLKVRGLDPEYGAVDDVIKVKRNAAGRRYFVVGPAPVATPDPESVRDTVAATLVAGPGVTITVDDAGNTITVSATAPATVLVPMTSQIPGGDPQLVFDSNGEVIMVEVPRS